VFGGDSGVWPKRSATSDPALQIQGIVEDALQAIEDVLDET